MHLNDINLLKSLARGDGPVKFQDGSGLPGVETRMALWRAIKELEKTPPSTVKLNKEEFDLIQQIINIFTTRRKEDPERSVHLVVMHDTLEALEKLFKDYKKTHTQGDLESSEKIDPQAEIKVQLSALRKRVEILEKQVSEGHLIKPRQNPRMWFVASPEHEKAIQEIIRQSKKTPAESLESILAKFLNRGDQ